MHLFSALHFGTLFVLHFIVVWCSCWTLTTEVCIPLSVEPSSFPSNCSMRPIHCKQVSYIRYTTKIVMYLVTNFVELGWMFCWGCVCFDLQFSVLIINGKIYGCTCSVYYEFFLCLAFLTTFLNAQFHECHCQNFYSRTIFIEVTLDSQDLLFFSPFIMTLKNSDLYLKVVNIIVFLQL